MSAPRMIVVVTGTRAEFGLLEPVMRAIADHDGLRLLVYACGAHQLKPDRTIDEVRAAFEIAATIPMQTPGQANRFEDAASLGRGITGIARFLARDRPDIVLVLGDRIEALAAAAAASVGGVRVAHMHGGDRAQGIADEAMRHAITKLAHIHLPATTDSAQHIINMGEVESRVHIVGSPAIDALAETPPIDDDRFADLGSPRIVVLHHPIGRDDEVEAREASMIIDTCRGAGPMLALAPNHDPGRAGIVHAIKDSGVAHQTHLPRSDFLGLLQRIDVIAGNSSAGLIECAALGLACVNIGPRQSGRDRPGVVFDVPDPTPQSLKKAVASALAHRRDPTRVPATDFYGTGDTGPRTAELLATLDLIAHSLEKRNSV